MKLWSTAGTRTHTARENVRSQEKRERSAVHAGKITEEDTRAGAKNTDQAKTEDIWDYDWHTNWQEDEHSDLPHGYVSKARTKRQTLRTVAITLACLGALYLFMIYTNLPFIAKWRTIYIETAMSTMTHQWLATAFIPQSVIDKAMNGRYNLDEQQNGLFSDWADAGGEGPASAPWEEEKERFFEAYPEIDRESFEAYFDAHSGEVIDDEGYLVIDKAGLEDGGTTIRTVHGDEVLAIDTRNGIVIVKIKGDGYVARMAIVKDASRVGVAVAEGIGSVGSTMAELAQHSEAVLAINASGFYDPDGHGNGGQPYGLVKSNGKLYNKAEPGNYKTIGFDQNDRLYIGEYSSADDFRDAVEFKPALIINGKKLVSGSAGWGVQPRSAIGQTEDGDVLLLIVDGRAPGYSIGSTLGDCADMLERYGAVQACNLDGGSSSVMYYNGREISRPSAANKVNGRRLPDGFVVYEK